MSEITEIVMRVLEGQSPDYFIYPNASAFVAESLDPELVAAELNELFKAGELEREQIIVEVETQGEGNNGSTKATAVGGGYRLRR